MKKIINFTITVIAIMFLFATITIAGEVSDELSGDDQTSYSSKIQSYIIVRGDSLEELLRAYFIIQQFEEEGYAILELDSGWMVAKEEINTYTEYAQAY